MQNNDIGPLSYTFTKINFNFRNLKIRPDDIKLLEENIGENLLDIALAMIFFFSRL